MICILGASASGKTTVAKMLASKNPYHRIVTYTTRPMRAGEVDGVDYHFVTDKKYQDMKENGMFAETAEYNGWKYATASKDCDDYAVAVVTPKGFRNLKKQKDIHIFSFYIDVPIRDRLIKSLQTREDVFECIRRSMSDIGQFDGVEDEVDVVIHNRGYSKTPEEIVDFMRFIMN